MASTFGVPAEQLEERHRADFGREVVEEVRTQLTDAHNALTARLSEVDIDVWHGLSGRVEESLEEQIVFQRVKVGNLQRISH